MGRLFATFVVLSAICTVSTSKAGELKIFKRTVWPESSPISNMENWLTPYPTASWQCELWGPAAKIEAEPDSQAEETDALALLENLDLEDAQAEQVFEFEVLGNIKPANCDWNSKRGLACLPPGLRVVRSCLEAWWPQQHAGRFILAKVPKEKPIELRNELRNEPSPKSRKSWGLIENRLVPSESA